MGKPIISVVIPVYNGEKYLRETLDSVFAQTRPADQVVVFNDMSTDKSLEICKDYEGRLEIYENESKASHFIESWTKAISYSKKEYICLLHQDDVLSTDFLELAEEALIKHPDAMHVYGICNYIDENGKLLRKREVSGGKFTCQTGKDYSHSYLYGRENRCPGTLIHYNVFQKCPFRKEADLIADTDFFIRVGAVTDVVRINRIVAGFRLHKDSTTNSYKNLPETLFYSDIFLYLDYQNRKILSEKGMRHLLWQLSHFFVEATYYSLVKYRFDLVAHYRRKIKDFMNCSGVSRKEMSSLHEPTARIFFYNKSPIIDKLLALVIKIREVIKKSKKIAKN